MIELLFLMLERVGILIIMAFLLSRMKSFRQIVHNEHRFKEKMILIAIFGTFGVISNYTGVEIEEGLISSRSWQTDVHYDGALANTRIMGVAIGGLLGGPLVGLGGGLIAGLHRLTLGGFTAAACSISTILAGIATGLIGKRFNIQKEKSPLWAMSIGVLMECIQMGIILLIARPFESAYHLVEVIALPMITINGFGTLVFILIIQTILLEEEKTRALHTHKALNIAEQTLPFFRQGLNVESCREAAEIILKCTNADAISITDEHLVLAHVGIASDHHKPMESLRTQLTKKVLEQGRIIKAKTREEIQCVKKDCPLQAALVMPLKAHNQTVGTLKLYYSHPDKLDQAEQELAEGLSRLFSTQLELAEAELQRKLLKDAEIKALQAQVHPHFLFNAINTISSLIRIDADNARKLLIQLSVFFRSNLQGARQMLIPLEKEIEHVEAYLSLEQARFPEKYTVKIEIDPSLKKVYVPPFTLQPLVENAIRHAFAKSKKGEVTIKGWSENGKMILTTDDNGRGVPPELLSSLGNTTIKSSNGTGTALWNIKKRIEEIFGPDGAFIIESEPEAGTKVTITLPLVQTKESEEYAKGFYR
ncbi:sensor histidine kinase [Bacillus methanolicus]|uniref:sensor histidine kinase n=1 Tax=Bacillus methanolicus TaxID=1471 RepID=UPI002380BC85|nr:sensor histidine kinase [Bacillus methanolicus]MDE3837852.1 sensor histidine kinase [Bacillus methanolicus]